MSQAAKYFVEPLSSFCYHTVYNSLYIVEKRCKTVQEEQAYYLNQICSENALYAQQNGKSKKCLIHTFGCQMNERDSEILFGFLTQMGYEKTEKESEADFILLNTCCIREKAEK